MKKHQFEEITMGIAVIASMIAWAIDFKIVAYAFMFKAGIDFFCLMKVIIKKRNKEYIIITRSSDGDSINIKTKWKKGELVGIIDQAAEHIKGREQ